jgi:hypothetical protein
LSQQGRWEDQKGQDNLQSQRKLNDRDAPPVHERHELLAVRPQNGLSVESTEEENSRLGDARDVGRVDDGGVVDGVGMRLKGHPDEAGDSLDGVLEADILDDLESGRREERKKGEVEGRRKKKEGQGARKASKGIE